MTTYSKTHLEFWKRRLRKPRFTRKGKRETSVNWSATFQYAGRRCEWSLGTPNKEAVAARARDIYLSLVSGNREFVTNSQRFAEKKRQKGNAKLTLFKPVFVDLQGSNFRFQRRGRNAEFGCGTRYSRHLAPGLGQGSFY
jgi:hypothetical protein